MEVAVKQETQVRKPAQTQEQVGQESSAQSNAAEESKRNSVPKAYPENFRFLVGEWESTTPGNNWQMRVSWDGKSGQFLGYLTKQGQASQAYGFRIGERVWTAEPIDEQTFVERQKFRGGFGNSWWNTQNVDVRESSRDHLSGYVEFKRVQ
jgi:hypothetical protein